MKDSKKCKKGFTIMEVLVTVSIVLLFSSILILSMNINKKILLKNTAFEIVSVLRYAHNASEHQNNSVQFQIVEQKGKFKYQVIEYGRFRTIDNEIPPNIKILARTALEERDTISKEFHFEMGTMPITLEFNSMSAIGTNSLIIMDNDLKEFYKITVVPTSSRVHIYKYEE